MGPGGFFPTNPDLADILGRTDLDFDNFIFWDFFGSQIFGPLDFRAPRGPTDFRALGPDVNFLIYFWKFPDFQRFLAQFLKIQKNPQIWAQGP